jgi:hypothetical protein
MMGMARMIDLQYICMGGSFPITTESQADGDVLAAVGVRTRLCET